MFSNDAKIKHTFLLEIQQKNNKMNKGIFIDHLGNVYIYNISNDPNASKYTIEDKMIKSTLIAKIDQESFIYLLSLIQKFYNYNDDININKIVYNQTDISPMTNININQDKSQSRLFSFINQFKIKTNDTNGNAATTSSSTSFFLYEYDPINHKVINSYLLSNDIVAQEIQTYLEKIKLLLDRTNFIKAKIGKTFTLNNLEACYVCGYDWKFTFDKSAIKYINSVSDCENKNSSSPKSNLNPDLFGYQFGDSVMGVLLPGKSCDKTAIFLPLKSGSYAIVGKLVREWENINGDDNDDVPSSLWIVHID